MNAKLRNILHTAWNEPRHFFFWLALLCFCGVAVVVIKTTGMIDPPVWVALVALGCLLCFLVSVAACLLAWIPPVRRLFSWLLCRRLLVLGCLVTLVALFYAIENWRGRRAWQDYRRAGEAKGERFDLASFVPPPIPNDHNFFETPLWTDLHFIRTNGATVWSDTNWARRVIFTAFGPARNVAPRNNAPSPGNWIKAERVDLKAWQAFYRGCNNVFAAKDGRLTNYFPVAQASQTPAVDVLLALSRFNQNRQLLIAASARPQARFWIEYDDTFSALGPHWSRMPASSQYLALHATAALQAGDRQMALEDVKLGFRLIESIRREPIVASHPVRLDMLRIGLQPVWEGLADRQWTEADLRVMASELGKLDFLADYHFAVRGERALDLRGMDYIRKQASLRGIADTPWTGPTIWPGEWYDFFGVALFRLTPSGWFDQYILSFCRLLEKYLSPLVVDVEQRVVPPAGVREAESVLEHQRWWSLDFTSGGLLADLTSLAGECGSAQSSVDLARVACALERYRRANGQFPETLEALAPKFLEKLPHDVINGQPLKYRRTDDGQFILYSIGWNETDDGGNVSLTKRGNPRLGQGDWVWRYPAR